MPRKPFLGYSDFWSWSPGDKFDFWESNIPEPQCQALRHGVWLHSRVQINIACWKYCYDHGVRVRDIHGHFGGDRDNIARSLNKGLLKSGVELWLLYGLELTGTPREEWPLTLQPWQRTIAIGQVVAEYRHQCIMTDSPLVRAAEIGGESKMTGSQARTPGRPLSPFESALLRATLDDPKHLKVWLTFGTAFATQDGSEVGEGLRRFLEKTIDLAEGLLAPMDRESRALCAAWRASVDGPLECLEFLAGVWNENQLYAHIVVEETRI